jgi:hypothetical protein
MEDDAYVSYLLRLQKSEAHGHPTWRVTLENIQTGEKQSFNLEGLLAFLRARFEGEGAKTGQNEPLKGGASTS